MDKYRDVVIAFSEAVKGKEFVCFDTETTGLKPTECDIIEFSAVKYKGLEDGTFQYIDELDVYINPGYPVPQEIVDITGITTEKLVTDGLSQKEAAEKIRTYLGDNPILIGYNSVSFDENFMKSFYQKILGIGFIRQFHLDVLKMAKEKTEKPHKLINMVEKLGINEQFQFHTSIEDVKATFTVFERLLPMYAEKESNPLIGFTVTRIQRWSKSATLDRIYVNNNIGASVFYDVVGREWNMSSSLNYDEVIKAVRDYSLTESDEELVAKY